MLFRSPFYDDSISVSEHSSETNSIKESHKEESLREPIAMPFRSRPKKQGKQQTWQWVKKQAKDQPLKHEQTIEKPREVSSYKPQKTKQVWVKKTLLQAQGYYQGQTSIWIHKKKLCKTTEKQEYESK